MKKIMRLIRAVRKKMKRVRKAPPTLVVGSITGTGMVLAVVIGLTFPSVGGVATLIALLLALYSIILLAPYVRCLS